jgi:hypothetical protein
MSFVGICNKKSFFLHWYHLFVVWLLLSMVWVVSKVFRFSRGVL